MAARDKESSRDVWAGFAFQVDRRLVSPRLVNMRWREFRSVLPGRRYGLVCEDEACAEAVRAWMPSEAAWCATVGGGCALLPLDALRAQIAVSEFLHAYRGWFTRIWFGIVRGPHQPPYGAGVWWPHEDSLAWYSAQASRVGVRHVKLAAT